MHDVVFSTERFAVRDFRTTDFPEVLALWQDPVALQFMDPPLSNDEAKAWLAGVIHHNQLVPRDVFNLAVVEPEHDVALGWVGFGPSDREAANGVWGVGYLLTRQRWGEGIMSEVVRGVVAHVVSRADVVTLQAHYDAANVGSGRVLEKAGFHLTHTRRDDDTGRQFRHVAIDVS